MKLSSSSGYGWEGNSATNPNRLRATPSSLTATFVHELSHQKDVRRRQIIFVHIPKWFTSSDCMLSCFLREAGGYPAAAVSHFISVDPRGRQWELVALTLTISYHDPHDLLQKVIVFQGYICILDSEQSGNCPKVELCPLPHKI
jgi:hypothetical protein